MGSKLTVITGARNTQAPDPKQRYNHLTQPTEGEAARLLLEDQGYHTKKTGGQYIAPCPFCEEPGQPPAKNPHFYLDPFSSQYYCHRASCQARGNLRTLEFAFGLGDDYTATIRTLDDELREHEQALTTTLMKPFLDDGLSEDTVRRFRIGWHQGKQCYVIPYLRARRPLHFRYYHPDHTPKYWWEEGTETVLFNMDDVVGDDQHRVLVAESEKKAMLLSQLGYAVVGVPGASTFKDDWFSLFNRVKIVYVVFDNDNPAFHVYDNCRRCKGVCEGHNPGQDAAHKLVKRFDWRGHNVVLPLPDDEARKTDINEYFVRDGHTAPDFAELAFGEKKTPYQVSSLSEIDQSPPEATDWFIEDVLVAGGRFLVTGPGKAGKSLFVENLALSAAAGIPFLGRFAVPRPCRVLLLDRELSRFQLFKRLNELRAARPGYRVGSENLLPEHDHQIRLDRQDSLNVLLQLVEVNGIDIVIFDTAYKFLNGLESSEKLAKAFDTLDQLIYKTGVTVVLTHHHRKGANSHMGKEDRPHPDQVVGSFLWTGWPNGTALINFVNGRVDDPFNTTCHFVAYRDAPPPEPLLLCRTKDSVAYSAIKTYDPTRVNAVLEDKRKPITTETLLELLTFMTPCREDDFIHNAAYTLQTSLEVIRPYYLDALHQGTFERKGDPVMIYDTSKVQDPGWSPVSSLFSPELETVEL